MASITGGERIARTLEAEGVEVVFGIVDGSYFGWALKGPARVSENRLTPVDSSS